MSTNAKINVKVEDNKYFSIYLHNDGGVHAFDMLNEHYGTYEKAMMLVSYGDMSSLRKNAMPDCSSEHSFNNSQADTCVFYHRDRGEPWETTCFRIDKEPEVDCQYNYLFENDEWKRIP